MPFVPLPRSVVRLARTVGSLLAATVLALAPTLAQSPSAADGFDPDVDGNVYAVALQPDGKLIVAGQFSSIGGAARSNLARLNLDGSVDAAFNPGANGAVRALLIQRDGRIVAFDQVDRRGLILTPQPAADGTYELGRSGAVEVRRGLYLTERHHYQNELN